MGSFLSLLKRVFGSKEDRDLKQIKPILANVLKEYERVNTLSNDELRAETEKVKQIIKEKIAADSARREELKRLLEDVNVSTKVVKIIQSYVGIINRMVWRKANYE